MHTPDALGNSTPHPILIIAAVAVVLFCSVGTAAILGWLPSSNAGGGNAPALRADAPPALPAQQDLAAPSGSQAWQAPSGQPAGTSYAPQQWQAATAQQQQPQQPQPQLLAQAAPAQPQDMAAQPRAMPAQPQEQSRPAVHHCNNCGVVVAVREVQHRGQGSGAGAVGGAVLGGLLGNQIGSGHGRQLATVAGAVGGAVAGNQIEGNMKSTRSYNIVVRLQNGHTRTFHQSAAPGWRAGDHVRIVNGALRGDD